MLIRYELQKIFSKRTNQIILLLLALLIAYACRNAISGIAWVDDQGHEETGSAAAVKLREARDAWSGPLNQAMLEKAFSELRHIYDTTVIDRQSTDVNWVLRNRLQGLQDIADQFAGTYEGIYDTFEEMLAGLQPEDLSHFYEDRVEAERAFLYTEGSWGYFSYTEAEKQHLLQECGEMETPLELGYHEGWVQADRHIPTLLQYGMILLSFVLAGIFSDEFSLKTDAIYYNTLHGRTKATAIKVWLGFLTVTLAYWLSVGIYSLVVFSALGADGGGYMLQAHGSYWNMRQNMTFQEHYGLVLGAGYLGYLLIGFLIMWISAKTKSPVLAVLIPSLLILLPMYLRQVETPTMRRFIGVLPDRLLDIGQALTYQYLYTIQGHITTAVPILLTVYPCITVLLVVLCYREYRHKQIV